MTESLYLINRLETIGRIFGMNINQLGQISSVEELFTQGTSLQFKEAQYQEAIAAYDRALKLNPNFWQAWLLRGIAQCQSRKFRDAVTSFEKVIELQPNPTATVAAFNGQTLAFTELRQYKNALLAQKKALEVKSTDATSKL